MTDEQARRTQLASHGDALLREAAHRLVDTVAPYGVLTRQDLALLSGADRWHTVNFEHALQWALEHGALRQLGTDLYEIRATT